MSDKLHVPKTSCDTCPYRRDTPAGIWDISEYEKLKEMDNREYGSAGCATFLCHQSNATGVNTACVGWLHTHGDNLGVRLAVMRGELDGADIPYECDEDTYFATGAEAYEAGISALDDPSDEARVKIQRLLKRGAGKLDV